MQTFFSINCRGQLIDLSQPKIMGILNLTPDSFSDGGRFNSEKTALDYVEKMISEGASMIDIGAQSTRPNAQKLSAEEEILRLGKVISSIKKKFPNIIISLDTFYAEVVKYGADQGVDLVNDISGGQYDEQMFSTVADCNLPYILMHVNNSYDLMHEKLITDDIILSLNSYYSEKVSVLRSLGIYDILLDPGFGFGKTIAQNHQMIDELGFIGFSKFPLLVGISRKSFIYKPLGKQPLEIITETQLLHHKALKNGAKILRVHDVAEAKRTLDQFLTQ